MGRSIPTIRAGVLIVEPPADGHRKEVPPESDAWFRWFESARTFAFEDASGHFTARKRRRWGAEYWYAFRRGSGRLAEAYLGKAQDLTLGRLHAIAVKLSQLTARTPELQPAAQPEMQPEMQTDAPVHLLPWQPPKMSPTRPNLSVAERHAPDAGSSHFIHTSAVERLAAAAVEYALTIVSAPTGFGKTTLLSQVVETLRLPTAWLSLDERDNDPIHFWLRVAVALKLATPGLLEAESLSGGGDRDRSVDVVRPAPDAALSQAPSQMLLVLDDYHTLRPDNYALHEAVTNFVERQAPHIHLLLASRTMPPLPLAALRTRHRVLELGAMDLQFSLAETRAFLNQRLDLGLSDEEISMLHARTEGWVAALQLAALSLREQADPREWIAAFNGENHHIFDYLLEEVVRRMPAHLRAFALQVSPLRRLTGSLCDAVTRSVGSQELLEEMERANLFLTPLGDQPGWYRLHPLFADAMRRRLRQTRPRLEPQIYARASVWCEAHGLALDAMDYAFAASELEAAHAAELVEVYIPAALASGYIAILRDRLERLPDNVVRDRPRLSVVHAYTLYLMGERAALPRRLRDAEQAIARTEHSLAPAELATLQAEILALRTTVRTLAGEASTRELIAAFHQASAALPGDHEFQKFITLYLGINHALEGNVRAANRTLQPLMRASLAQGNRFYVGRAMLYLNRAMLLQGRLDAALALCARVARRQPDVGDDALTAGLHLMRGKVFYERGELEAAVDHLRQGMALGYAPGASAIEAYSTLAHAQLALGDPEAAQQAMEQCIALWEEEQTERTALWVWAGHQVRMHQAHLRLLQGDVEWAAAWALDLRRAWDSAPANGLEPPAFVRESENIVLAQLYLAEHRAGDALILLNTLEQATGADGRVAQLLETLVLRAIACSDLDDTPAALVALQRAVELGRRQRIVRPFIEGGPTIQRLLTLLQAERAGHAVTGRRGRVAKEDALQKYMWRLLNAFSPAARSKRRRYISPSAATGSDRRSTNQPVPALTPREHEVLRLIADGASNNDIARALVIAPSTAKRHVSNIFTALDVHRRTQAVARARALGLLNSGGPGEASVDREY